MEAGENNKTLCQKCGENHQTLRLSLRKRAKKCFSRSKKKLQEGNILTLLIRDFWKIMHGMENVMRELKNYAHLRKIFNILTKILMGNLMMPMQNMY